MPILDLDYETLSAISRENFTPSKEIETEQRLFGRDDALRRIERAINSEGRHIFIYGDRGVGKTSVARTVARLHNFKDEEHIYVTCGQNMDFGKVMQAVGNSMIDPRERSFPSSNSVKLSVNLGIGECSYSSSKDRTAQVAEPTNVAEALDLLKSVDSRRHGRLIVVVDELDAINDGPSTELFAELVKNASTVVPNIRFVFCGIGASIDEILGSHPSANRYFETVHLKTLHHNHLWQIVMVVAEKTGVTIDHNLQMRISIISDGFPHFVHLLGSCLFYAMHDDEQEVSRCERRHFEKAVEDALTGAEPGLRAAYEKATYKTRNRLDFEEALWALADTSETKRQITKVHDGSYKRIMRERPDRVSLNKEKLNQRFLRLRDPSHGSILKGHGSGWYSFRENVMRGYVRLQAQNQGVVLKPES